MALWLALQRSVAGVLGRLLQVQAGRWVALGAGSTGRLAVVTRRHRQRHHHWQAEEAADNAACCSWRVHDCKSGDRPIVLRSPSPH
jgi:hypothetical protein